MGYDFDRAAWQLHDLSWGDKRLAQWNSQGAKLVATMFQRGGDLNVNKAEAIKQYFLTGEFDENHEFPLFYIVRFYPGDSDEWLRAIFENATDSQVARFFYMYSSDSLGKNNAKIANIIYSNYMTDRLSKMPTSQGKKSTAFYLTIRDKYLFKERVFYNSRYLTKTRPKPDHYAFSISNYEWLRIAQDYESRLNQHNEIYIELFEYLMGEVVTKLADATDNVSSPEMDFAKNLKNDLDLYIEDKYGLLEYWAQLKEKHEIE